MCACERERALDDMRVCVTCVWQIKTHWNTSKRVCCSSYLAGAVYSVLRTYSKSLPQPARPQPVYCFCAAKLESPGDLVEGSSTIGSCCKSSARLTTREKKPNCDVCENAEAERKVVAVLISLSVRDRPLESESATLWSEPRLEDAVHSAAAGGWPMTASPNSTKRQSTTCRW